MLEKQKVFNQCVIGVINQGAYAYNGEHQECFYYVGGLRCAIGQLAESDEQAKNWDKDGLSAPDILSILGYKNVSYVLFKSIQNHHDRAAAREHKPSQEFYNQMSLCARKYNLKIPEELEALNKE